MLARGSRLQRIMVGKSVCQELQAAGHMTVKRRAKMNAYVHTLSLCVLLSYSPEPKARE